MKATTLRFAFALSAVLSTSATFAQVRMTDYRSLITPVSVQVSPDGKQVAFVKSTKDFKNDAMVTMVEVVDVATGAMHAVSDGKRVVASPRWSPNGDRIAFMQEVAPKLSQLYAASAKGGVVRQITSCDRGVQQFSWSPDGDRFAYVTPDPDPNAEQIRTHNDLFDMGNDGFLTSTIPVPSHIWLVSSKGGAPTRLTHGAWSVLETPPPFAGTPSDPSWSSDGKSIVFCRQADADDSDSDLTSAAVTSVADGSITTPTAHGTYEYQPSFSTESNAVAYLYPQGPTALSAMDVMVHDSSGDHNVTASGDRDFLDFKWLPGGGILTIATDGLGRYLWLAKDGAVNKLDLEDRYPSEVNANKSGSIAYVASNATTPPEVYFLAGASAKPKQLTNFNDKLKSLNYSRVEEIKWSSPDGENCDGVLTYPAGFREGSKYPLVMFIHGGPEASAPALYIGFEGDLLRQSLAADGFVVFEPNYRGSDNLGNEHEHAIYRNPAEGPAKDLLSGIDAVEKLGIVDDSKVAVAGHSYGGYMTAWLISHDHRWRCACLGDGAFDWTQEYNLAADGNLAWTRDSLGGGPSDPESADLYKTFSPLNYAADITTPCLLLSGTSDETVPITMSFSLYHVLKDHKVPVRFIAIPGAHHLPDDPVRQELFYKAMEDWIIGHMGEH